jgi:hypothetical protein
MTARAFGKPKLSPILEKAVKSSYEDRNNRNVKTIFVDKLSDLDKPTQPMKQNVGMETEDTD